MINSTHIVRFLAMIGTTLTISIFCQRVSAQDALWRSYFTSAQQAYHRGDYEGAEKFLNRAQDSARRTDDSLTTFYYLARCCEKLGNYEQAERNYRTVLDHLGPKIWATLRPPDGAPTWDDIVDSSEAERTLSEPEYVRMLGNRKQPMQSRLAKPITTVDVLTDLGLLYQEQKRYQEAEQSLRQALVLSELRTESIPFTQPRILQRLASLYAFQGRKEESDAILAQLKDLRAKSMPEFDQLVQKNIRALDRFGANHDLVATKLNNLALFCATHGDYSRADTLYNRALANCDPNTVHKHPDAAIILRNYADLLEAMGRTDEARKILRHADGISMKVDEKMLKQKSPVSSSATHATTDGAEDK